MLRGGYICVRNDNAELFNAICGNLNRTTTNQESIKNEPKLVTNKGLIPGSSHPSYVDGVSEECKDKLNGNNQIRFGKGIIYDMNEDGSLNEEKGSTVYDLIMGVTVRNETWFQFERTRTDTIGQKLLHIKDFFEHRATKQNIGPFGRSNYTDKGGRRTYYYLDYTQGGLENVALPSTLNVELEDPYSLMKPDPNANEPGLTQFQIYHPEQSMYFPY